MLENQDYVNIIAIILELIGFIILISRVKSFMAKIRTVSKGYDVMAESNTREEIETMRDSIENQRRFRRKQQEEFTWKVEFIGILFVILGLLGQLISVVWEDFVAKIFVG